MHRWSVPETNELVRLVEQYGVGSWGTMLDDGKKHGFFGAENVNPDETYPPRSNVSRPSKRSQHDLRANAQKLALSWISAIAGRCAGRRQEARLQPPHTHQVCSAHQVCRRLQVGRQQQAQVTQRVDMWPQQDLGDCLAPLSNDDEHP